jgi:predicted PurR-regulated permease PerM
MNDSSTNVETIRISSDTIVRTILFILLFLAIYILRDLGLILLTAVVIASAIEPATRWFATRGVPRILAVIGIYLSVAVTLTLLVYFFLPPLLGDVADVIDQAPQYLANLHVSSTSDATASLLAPHQISGLADWLSTPETLTQIRGLLAGATGGAFSLASTIFGGVLSFILIVVLSFYLAVQKDGIATFLRVITPYRNETYVINLWRRAQLKIGLWLQGQLTLSLIVGVMTFIGLLILGVPNAFLLALLAAGFEVIPVFGPFLSAIPAVAIALIDGGATLGLVTVLLYIIVQQVENHVLYPLVVKKVVGVPAIVVIISLLAGAQLAGFLGVILSVPMAAVLMEVIKDVDGRKRKLHPQESTDTTALV